MGELKEELIDSLRELVKHQSDELDKYSKQLEILNPKAVLSRGYSISIDESGKPIKSTKSLKPGQKVQTILEDGSFESEVIKIQGE